ncbi:MAG: hypothetical protein WBA07_27210, partial [Rivularia sp. (in: cyanobacteria)]
YLQLEWIYAKTEQKPKKSLNEEIILPSPAEMEKLFDLAMRGNVNGIENLLDDLDSDDSFKPFVAKVRQLAENFKFKQIRQYIKSFQVENT